MQPEHAVDCAEFSRLDQFGMRDGDSVERTFELSLPEKQKVLERWKIGKQILILPDVSL
jgi:hypothetical protein